MIPPQVQEQQQEEQQQQPDSQEAPNVRPAFIGIHSREDSTQILYISSGVRQTLGFTPAHMLMHGAKEFIADSYSEDYASIFKHKQIEDNSNGEEGEDEANAYVMYMNIKTAEGDPVLNRVTTFKCDNCVIVISMAFPEVPYTSQHELQVQMLDGAMKRMVVNRERDSQLEHHKKYPTRQGARQPLYFARNRQIKAAFVLENPQVATVETEETGRRQNGPLVVFVTGSVSRLIDADNTDLMGFPFLKLVAPEDVLHVGRFFERLSSSTDVLFETFSILQRPDVIEGDVHVEDEDNPRVVVECLGANVTDGVALLMRKLRVSAAPKRDSLGNFIRTKVHEIDDEGGYMSLSEIISSDPESSDAPVWSRLH
ncbi:hypothetical protein H4R20_000187 [Coemansia guatemalensis]|uniref:PAS domain-containing protein n=1 Tax=Coemansia guatemalensis TaxID=2761395 RepID=A0A9W8I4F1_9FUNG|nr:hypothetical protein H4R20_000187 [Coemansia guatemalensis]